MQILPQKHLVLRSLGRGGEGGKVHLVLPETIPGQEDAKFQPVDICHGFQRTGQHGSEMPRKEELFPDLLSRKRMDFSSCSLTQKLYFLRFAQFSPILVFMGFCWVFCFVLLCFVFYQLFY